MDTERNRFTMRTAVVCDATLSVGARLLYVLLDELAGPKGNCWWSVARLAQKLGVSARSVDSWMGELNEIYIRSVRMQRATATRTLLWFLEAQPVADQEALKRSPLRVRNAAGCVSLPYILNQESEPRSPVPDEVRQLLAEFPGAERLPPGPDATICSQTWEAAGRDLDALCGALRALYLDGKKPERSWAWFPTVVQARARRRA